jgi:tetratricopeptide (TPR) repeat protein
MASMASWAAPMAAQEQGSAAGPRARWLAEGEAQLAAGLAEAALEAFERAAQMQHAADAEVGIVRSHMQAGEYRRALSFGSHAAGAHRDHPQAMALYVWLLRCGGEAAAARRYLAQGLQGSPDDPDLRWVSGSVPSTPKSSHPAATPAVADDRANQDTARPAWLGPSATGAGVAPWAHVSGSGVLLSDGRRAWVPLATIDGARELWLRNGLGQTAAAEVLQREPGLGVALLRLRTPLARHEVAAAARDPFPGSPGALVEFDPDAAPRAAWPMLRQGFFGRALMSSPARALGIEAPPGPRGGPVFDRSGRLAGMAVAAADGTDRLLSWGDLAAAAPDVPLERRAGPASDLPAGPPPGPAPVDAVYEAALRVAVQVLVAD